MPDELATHTRTRLLIGRLAEYEELLGVLDTHQGLTVISADPWSGTSALLQSAVEELQASCVLVDARRCADELDLAMAIADAAVTALAPDAAGWWDGTAPPASTAGLRLSRTLSEASIELDDLRLGAGRPETRLDEAFELLLALADDRRATVVIDHAGLLLAGMPAPQARQLLGRLRRLRQAHDRLDLMLVEHPDGDAATAMRDSEHPLYQAGRELRIRRPVPARYIDDMAIARSWTDAPVPVLRIAAELASGVPWLTWQIIDRSDPGDADPRERALSGWTAVRAASEAATIRQWDLLRRLHPHAQTVFAALATDLAPHAIAANSKSVTDALRRLGGVGLAWQPEPRRWAIGDPLLAAWARENAPSWIRRRRRNG